MHHGIQILSRARPYMSKYRTSLVIDKSFVKIKKKFNEKRFLYFFSNLISHVNERVITKSTDTWLLMCKFRHDMKSKTEQPVVVIVK